MRIYICNIKGCIVIIRIFLDCLSESLSCTLKCPVHWKINTIHSWSFTIIRLMIVISFKVNIFTCRLLTCIARIISIILCYRRNICSNGCLCLTVIPRIIFWFFPCIERSWYSRNTTVPNTSISCTHLSKHKEVTFSGCTMSFIVNIV